MRTLIYGAGAVGGFAGGILAAAGADVTLVARGAHHDPMRSRGLILEGKVNGRPDPIRVNVCRPGEEKPPYDFILVGLKSLLAFGATPVGNSPQELQGFLRAEIERWTRVVKQANIRLDP